MGAALRSALGRCSVDILIVEDEAPLRESLADGLTSALDDARVQVAGSAEEAEQILASGAPKLVISDVRLPGRDGVEFLIDVRRRWPGTPFIFMSAYPSPEAEQQARTRGIRFLRKPFDFSELVDAVESALEASQFTGELGGISVVDLLQVLNLGRRTAAVTLSRSGAKGTIFLSEGEVVHAEVGDLCGREAFDQLISWKGGSFASEPGRTSPTVTIREAFNGLLLDAFRQQDEEFGEDPFDGFDEAFAAVEEDRVQPATKNDRPIEACLDDALRVIPGCTSAACVDLDARSLVAALPASTSEDAAHQIPAAAATLFLDTALGTLDAALAGCADRGANGAHAKSLREVIIRSSDSIQVLHRPEERPQQAFVAVCHPSAKLGTVVARTRAWLRMLIAATRA